MNKILAKIKQLSQDPIFWARFAGYAIPLAFLAYVLYINFLPFGYHKTFTINVGSTDDTKVSEFYLEPSPNLSDRKVAKDGTPYRELNGMAKVVFKPNVVLKNTTITVETPDPGITIIPPYINFDPASVQWDKSWDFTKGVPSDLKNNKAFYFDNATFFDGTARVELASSSNMFEDDAFSVYAEWMPIDAENDAQQIVGHFNWELWQNKNSVSFQVGRMNDNQGLIYKIKLPVTEDFFNTKHSALAIYNPSENGYAELYVDGTFANRAYFDTSTIWGDYGKENLSFGWTPHNNKKSPHFRGSLYNVSLATKNIIPNQSKFAFITGGESLIDISLTSITTSTFKQIKLNTTQR